MYIYIYFYSVKTLDNTGKDVTLINRRFYNKYCCARVWNCSVTSFPNDRISANAGPAGNISSPPRRVLSGCIRNLSIAVVHPIKMAHKYTRTYTLYECVCVFHKNYKLYYNDDVIRQLMVNRSMQTNASYISLYTHTHISPSFYTSNIIIITRAFWTGARL